MKKIIICLLSIFLIANVAKADCSNGTVIKGKNGTSYCKSNIKMTWFSAFSWCESQGMTLATVEEACPGAQDYLGCQNFVGAYTEWISLWTATPYNETTANALEIRTTYNEVWIRSYSRSSSYFALCK